MTKTTNKQKKHSKHRSLSLKIKPPPFPPPGKNAASVINNNTNHRHWPILISYCRYGSKQQFYVFFVKKGSVPLSLEPIAQFLQSNAQETIDFKKYTNILTPPLAIRYNRENDNPVRIESNGVTYMCLFSVKPPAVSNKLYAPCVMKQIKQVLKHKTQKSTTYYIQKKESTQERVSSLDHLLTDNAIKTAIYYHFYHAELQPYNYDFVRREFVLHAELTNSFRNDSETEAPSFFSPLNGSYSETAKLFGYQ